MIAARQGLSNSVQVNGLYGGIFVGNYVLCGWLANGEPRRQRSQKKIMSKVWAVEYALLLAW